MTINNKSTGSFYTPKWLSDFICDHIINNKKRFDSKINILEPSCGDGVFLRSLSENKKLKDKIETITIFETSDEELQKAKNILACKPYQEDFLLNDSLGKFDLIIGNPPYIDKKYLSGDQRESYRKWYEYGGIGDKTILNIWPAFVYKCEYLLSENGILSFVLPEELLRVNYGNHVLNFLKDHFERIEIFMINKVIFGDAGQNTVVVIAYKKSKFKGVFQGNIDLVGNSKMDYTLESTSLSKIDLSQYSQKNIGSQLNNEDQIFIENINKRFSIFSELATSRTGVVTGANSFFILNRSDQKKYGLEGLCIPIIQKGSHANKALIIDKKEFDSLVDSDKACFFLRVEGTAKNPNVINYLRMGERQGLNLRHKLGSYNPNWYNIPNIGPSKLVFFKRTHIFPKLILNQYNAEVTDSAYRIRLNDEGKEKEFQYSFYNSFTLLMMEILGRFYGGGVLELTPKEFKALPIPFVKEIPSEKLQRFYQSDLKDIESVLEENDMFILRDSFGITEDEIQKIKALRLKLLKIRLK